MHLTKRQVQGCQLLATTLSSQAPTRQIGSFLLHDVNERLSVSQSSTPYEGTALVITCKQCGVRSTSLHLTCHADENLKVRAHRRIALFTVASTPQRTMVSNLYSSYVALFPSLFFSSAYLCCSIIKTNRVSLCVALG